MSLEQAKALHAKGVALFADARSGAAFAEGHIKGARHLDPYEFDRWAEGLIESVAPDRPIIAYCDGPRCPLARTLAEKLTWLGFENIYHLPDGWQRWQATGLPVDHGSGDRQP